MEATQQRWLRINQKANERRRTSHCDLQVGNRVVVKNRRSGGKFQTPLEPEVTEGEEEEDGAVAQEHGAEERTDTQEVLPPLRADRSGKTDDGVLVSQSERYHLRPNPALSRRLRDFAC
ncbi:hypothetical protein NDU88_004784 [Pleurodeles waltl]|uniref:Uncharacterized protein n=1 Tax=Pleurodeles waltl TaxID=8319 RepID=A0AAV7RKH0_PLEWA|nr:hypothetical protein NDU88_004784 [Pleurodeles waltl]